MKARLLRILAAVGLALAASAFLVLQIWQPMRSPQSEPAQAITETGSGQTAGSSAISLRGGWYEFAPFQAAIPGKTAGAEGLDITILADVVRAAGMEVHLQHRSWRDQLDDLEAGRADVAMGAFKPSDGDGRFHYSAPYRQARIAFFVREEDEGRYDLGNAAEMLRGESAFRFGLVAGRLFQDAELNAAIAQARSEGRVVLAQTEEENLRTLVAGRIDGFIADRMGVAATILKTGLKSRTAETVLPGTAGVRLIFSRKTVSPEMVERLDTAIRGLEQNGRLTHLFQRKVSSVVMNYAMGSVIFMALAIIATVAAALSGFLIAFEEQYTLFGAFVLAALTAVGGGVVRDVLLNRTPVILVDPLWLSLVILTVLLGFASATLAQWMGRSAISLPPRGRLPHWINIVTVQEACDAAGLAAFTVSGVAAAVAMNAEPLWLWGPLAAMLTGAGGGILRDIVRQAGRIETLKLHFYAEVPLIWGLLFSLYLTTRPPMLNPEQIGLAMIVTAVGAFVTRMAAVLFGLRGIPLKIAHVAPEKPAAERASEPGRDKQPAN